MYNQIKKLSWGLVFLLSLLPGDAFAQGTGTSPDEIDSYMSFKLGTKKSSYDKKNLSELTGEGGGYRVQGIKLDSFFHKEVSRCDLQFEARKLKEISIDLIPFKATEDTAMIRKYISSVYPKIEQQLGGCTSKGTTAYGFIYSWTGKSVQVELTVERALAPALFGDGTRYFRRRVILRML